MNYFVFLKKQKERKKLKEQAQVRENIEISFIGLSIENKPGKNHDNCFLDYNMSIYSWIISTNNIFFLNYKKNYGAQASLYYLLNCRINFGSTGISGKQHKHESIV